MTRRAALAGALGLALGLGPTVQAAMPPVDMAEVRRLAREPVETILAGVPIGRVSDADYGKTVQGSPVVVVFSRTRTSGRATSRRSPATWQSSSARSSPSTATA